MIQTVHITQHRLTKCCTDLEVGGDAREWEASDLHKQVQEAAFGHTRVQVRPRAFQCNTDITC